MDNETNGTVYYEVVVGNVGTVHRGYDCSAATRVFDDYVELSQAGTGRAGDETVTLFAEQLPILEHLGRTLDDEMDV